MAHWDIRSLWKLRPLITNLFAAWIRQRLGGERSQNMKELLTAMIQSFQLNSLLKSLAPWEIRSNSKAQMEMFRSTVRLTAAETNLRCGLSILVVQYTEKFLFCLLFLWTPHCTALAIFAISSLLRECLNILRMQFIFPKKRPVFTSDLHGPGFVYTVETQGSEKHTTRT